MAAAQAAPALAADALCCLGLGFLLITLGGFGICAFAPRVMAAPSHTCPHCGAPMKQGQAFCQACGQPQSGSSAAPDASPYPPHP